jgi:hypothetical protein
MENYRYCTNKQKFKNNNNDDNDYSRMINGVNNLGYFSCDTQCEVEQQATSFIKYMFIKSTIILKQV